MVTVMTGFIESIKTTILLLFGCLWSVY